MSELSVLQAFYDTHAALNQVTGQLFDKHGAYMQCQKGCAGCCKDNFRIRHIEALELLRGFAMAPPAVAVAILNNLNPMSASAQSGDCPVLINQQCALYNSRPVLCKAFGHIVQLGDTTATCPLNFQDLPQAVANEKPASFPLLVLDDYYHILDTLSAQITDAPQLQTIRQWFSQALASVPAPPESPPAETLPEWSASRPLECCPPGSS